MLGGLNLLLRGCLFLGEDVILSFGIFLSLEGVLEITHFMLVIINFDKHNLYRQV